jgi:hypothetical protein
MHLLYNTIKKDTKFILKKRRTKRQKRTTQESSQLPSHNISANFVYNYKTIMGMYPLFNLLG